MAMPSAPILRSSTHLPVSKYMLILGFVRHIPWTVFDEIVVFFLHGLNPLWKITCFQSLLARCWFRFVLWLGLLDVQIVVDKQDDVVNERCCLDDNIHTTDWKGGGGFVARIRKRGE